VGGRILVTRDVNALPVGKRAEPGDPTPLGPDASPPPAGGRARTTILAPRVQGKRHRRLRLRIAGRVGGAPRCSGRMTIAVRNQGRTLRHKGGALRRTCRYGVVLRIRRVGRARRLVLRIRYGGNATALPARARYVLRLRELDR
jgi:hypothetical protein